MSDPDLDIELKLREGIAQLKGSLERLREVEVDASMDGEVLRIERAVRGDSTASPSAFGCAYAYLAPQSR